MVQDQLERRSGLDLARAQAKAQQVRRQHAKARRQMRDQQVVAVGAGGHAHAVQQQQRRTAAGFQITVLATGQGDAVFDGCCHDAVLEWRRGGGTAGESEQTHRGLPCGSAASLRDDRPAQPGSYRVMAAR
ncbi:MAG: hypothetical protein ACLGHR_11230, partial [Gammaproteobacteria bacterium]